MSLIRAAPVEVYLQPAVVGGGVGDIEEVLAVGRELEPLGLPLRLFRAPGRPLPRSVNGPWDWPRLHRVARLRPDAPRALTVTPWWGVSTSPGRGERPGRSGPWSVETEAIEQAYGPDHVVHLSLEEFARTLTSRRQTQERWREGGVSVREIRRRSHDPAYEGEITEFRAEYRRWRAFDWPNVVHWFTGFRPSRAFAREFPEAIQTGPLWPRRFRPVHRGLPRSPSRRWVWYASPSTSDRLARALSTAFGSDAEPGFRLEIAVGSPREFARPERPGLRWRELGLLPPQRWRKLFRDADVRIVTGSRTLLEALELEAPFLYFNGVTHPSPRTRRHRPEKIETLLAVWRARRVARRLRSDLAAFARLRRVAAVVRRAVTQTKWGQSFPSRQLAVAFRSPWDNGGCLLRTWVRRWARSEEGAAEFVRRLRQEGKAAVR